MSYFEYTLTGDLNAAFEEKTQLLISKMNDGSALYYIKEYRDEEVSPEAKKRTIVITSQLNIWEHLFSILSECKNNLHIIAYHKNRFI